MISLSDNIEYQGKFDSYLEELSSTLYDKNNQTFNEIRVVAERLFNLHEDGFRYSRSKLFSLLQRLSQQNPSLSIAESETFDMLTYNLSSLCALVEKEYGEAAAFKENIRALCDDIMLETGRIARNNNFERRSNNLAEELKSTAESLGGSQSDLTKTKEELDAANERLSSLQSDIIASISIFSAVVIAFSGSFSFITSALSSIQSAPVLRTAFFVLLCGFVICNAIFVLIYSVAKITNKDIFANCSCAASDTYSGKSACSCKSCNKRKTCSGIIRIRQRLPYIFWFNVILLLLMGVVIIAWFFGLMEYRNIHITNKYYK